MLIPNKKSVGKYIYYRNKIFNFLVCVCVCVWSRQNDKARRLQVLKKIMIVKNKSKRTHQAVQQSLLNAHMNVLFAREASPTRRP
jgi:hypothetical protein